MTTAAQRAWLKRQDVTRVVLVELDYMYQVGIGADAVPTVGTLYFSNAGYIDNDAQIEYVEAITADGHPKYSRAVDRVSLRGAVQSSVSAIKLNNADGRLSQVLTLPIDGSDVRVYVGDPSWAKSDFVQFPTATAVKAGQTLDTLTIELSDVQLLIDRNIGGEVTIGGTGPNADKFRPYPFGFVHQLEPIMIDEQNFAYADSGENTSVVAVRSNGVPFTAGTDYTDNGDSTFTLAVPVTANERITCDVLRHAASSATDYRLKDAIAAIVGGKAGLTAAGKYYGPDATYFDSGTSVNPLNDYHVGDAILDKTNVGDWLDKACDTGNICYGADILNRLRLFRLRPEALNAIIGLSGGRLTVARELTEDDYDVNTLQLTHAKPRFVGYQSYANVNQVSQTEFSSSLSQEDKAMYTRKGRYGDAFRGEEVGTTQYLGADVPYKGGAPELYHRSMTDSQVVATLISGPDDTGVIDVSTGLSVADYQAAWSALRRAQGLPWTEFIDGTVGLDCFDLELGNIINLTLALPQFALEGGALHQVCSIAIDPMAGIDLGVCRRRFAGVSGPLPSLELREDGGVELREDGGRELRE